MILRGIMASREVDRPIELRPLDFVSDGWRRREGLAKQRPNVVLLENRDRELRKLLRIKSRVIPNQNRRILRLAVHVLRDRRHRQPHIRKRKIVGNQPAPSGCAELDRTCVHHGRSAHTVVFYSQFLEDESIRKNFRREPHEAQRELPSRARHLRQSHPGKAHRPKRRRKTPGRLRQLSSRSHRAPLSLKGKREKSGGALPFKKTQGRKTGGLEERRK